MAMVHEETMPMADMNVPVGFMRYPGSVWMQPVLQFFECVFFNIPLFFAWFLHAYGEQRYHKKPICPCKKRGFLIVGHLFALAIFALICIDIIYFYIVNGKFQTFYQGLN